MSQYRYVKKMASLIFRLALYRIISQSLILRNRDALWRIVNSSQFAHAAFFEITFHDLVSQQRQHATAHEDRSRVAIPIDARSAARIVDGFFRLRAEFSYLFKVQGLIAQEKNRRGTLK